MAAAQASRNFGADLTARKLRVGGDERGALFVENLLAAGAPAPTPRDPSAAVVLSVQSRFVDGVIVTRADVESGGVVREVEARGGRVGDIEQVVFHAPSGTALRVGAHLDPAAFGLR